MCGCNRSGNRERKAKRAWELRYESGRLLPLHQVTLTYFSQVRKCWRFGTLSRRQGQGSPGSRAGNTTQWIFVRVLRTDTPALPADEKSEFPNRRALGASAEAAAGKCLSPPARPLRRCPGTGTCPHPGHSGPRPLTGATRASGGGGRV